MHFYTHSLSGWRALQKLIYVKPLNVQVNTETAVVTVEFLLKPGGDKKFTRIAKKVVG